MTRKAQLMGELYDRHMMREDGYATCGAFDRGPRHKGVEKDTSDFLHAQVPTQRLRLEAVAEVLQCSDAGPPQLLKHPEIGTLFCERVIKIEYDGGRIHLRRRTLLRTLKVSFTS